MRGEDAVTKLGRLCAVSASAFTPHMRVHPRESARSLLPCNFRDPTREHAGHYRFPSVRVAMAMEADAQPRSLESPSRPRSVRLDGLHEVGLREM